MQVTTLPEVEEKLQEFDPDTLREMAYQVAHSHVTVCELTSKIGGCAHISAEQTRNRVDSLSVAEIAAILAPSAWMSIDLHRRIGG
jgi:hypothetical protein